MLETSFPKSQIHLQKETLIKISDFRKNFCHLNYNVILILTSDSQKGLNRPLVGFDEVLRGNVLGCKKVVVIYLRQMLKIKEK